MVASEPRLIIPPSDSMSRAPLDVRMAGIRQSWVRDGAEHEILSGIDLHIRGGEFMALVGPSGCGKSTLLRIVAGLQAPSCGQAWIGDAPVTGPRADVGMVFQEASLYPWLTAAGNVAFGPLLQGVAASERRTLAQLWLERVGLGQAARLYPYQLSGGMKQRVAIARAFANGAQVLLMDEPFAALDYLARRNMQDLLMELWSDLKMTVLFVTHHLDEAVLMADRVAMLSPGPSASLVQVTEIGVPRPRQVDGEWIEVESRRVRSISCKGSQRGSR